MKLGIVVGHEPTSISKKQGARNKSLNISEFVLNDKVGTAVQIE